MNPLGYVPALMLDDGTLLTEGAAILQYIADLVPEKTLAPPNTRFKELNYKHGSICGFGSHPVYAHLRSMSAHAPMAAQADLTAIRRGSASEPSRADISKPRFAHLRQAELGRTRPSYGSSDTSL